MGASQALSSLSLPAVVIEVVVRWWLGGTNDEPRWLIVVVGVDQQEQTNDKPTWLVVFVVGVDGQEQCGWARTVWTGENGWTMSLGGSSLS